MLSSLESVSLPFSEDAKISAAELARYRAPGVWKGLLQLQKPEGCIPFKKLRFILPLQAYE